MGIRSGWDGSEWCGGPESAGGASWDVESGMGVDGSGAILSGASPVVAASVYWFRSSPL